ncbi:uncharacterized protein LOC116164070 [Photinus pyralis]|uniref:uncharacterized protein LOC116164070 n=1 Tax=Photinus pyralis TaxID=7054 RepID=UPI00126707BD|nr:uncharacterized protein LOC116164070 [Photinus pyralis]
MADFERAALTALITKKRCPWITDVIRVMMSLRDKALKEYKASIKDINANLQLSNRKWIAYKSIRNFVTASIRREKRAYMEHVLKVNVDNPKKFWSNLKTLSVHSNDPVDTIPIYLRNAEDLNKYFINSIKAIPPNYTTMNEFSASVHPNVKNPFSVVCVSKDDVERIAYSIKSNSPGTDNINTYMIRLCLPFCLDALTHINFSFSTNTFPSIWKQAKIRPIPKVEAPQTFSDFRLISILPMLSKIIERVALRQLQSYLLQNDLLPGRQSGFRKGFSTSCLLDLTDDILRAMDEGKITLLLIYHLGSSESALAWFENYLTGRCQYVALQEKCGERPLLFSLFTFDFSRCVHHGRYHSYADDNQIYYSFYPDQFSNTTTLINEDLHRISEWSSNNSLILNPSKTVGMLIGKKHLLGGINSSLTDVNIDSNVINFKTVHKSLGLILDENLTLPRM